MLSTDRDLRNLAVAAWSLGWTAPILVFLGRTPAFFIARNLDTLESIGVISIVAAGPAAVLWAVRWLPAGPRRWMWHASSALALGVIMIRAADFTSSPGVSLAMLGIGPVLGWAISDFGLRIGWFREWVKLLAWTPLALVLVVIGFYPTGQSLRNSPSGAAEAGVDAEPLVVLVIFDEMPLASMMNESGNIRPWYPAFRELASDSVWFRNSVTVHGFTQRSVPAILSGVLPDHNEDSGVLADMSSHPNTIFTISDWHSGISALEPVTDLCVLEHCDAVSVRAPWPRLTSLLVQDLNRVALRSLLPEHVRRVPSFSDENFVWNARNDRRIAVKSAVERLGTSSSRLFVFHLLVPHSPFQYDATGRELIPYSEAIGAFNGDDAATLHSHLLQVGYADSVLRDIVAKLKAHGLYDEALLAVVADHGISFRGTASSRRDLAQATVGDIGFVPMIVKLPYGERAGEVSDFPAMTVDLLPTIAGAVGLRVPWSVDGVDLLDGRLPDAASRRVIPGLGFDRDFAQALEAASWIDGFFPGGDLYRFVPSGAIDLVGQEALDLGAATDLVWREFYQASEAAGPGGASVIRGELAGQIPANATVAVVSQGSIAAMAVLSDTRPARFAAVVDGRRLGDSFELALVERDGSLTVIPRQSPRWPTAVFS